MEWRAGTRRAFWLMVVAAALLLALAGPALGYSISGKVTAAGTGQPVTACELQLWYLHTDGTSWYRAGVYDEPAADGSYALDFYNSGHYRVQCYNSPVFVDQWWNQAATPDLATTITVPGDELTGIDFSLGSSSKTGSALSLAAPTTCAYRAASLSGYLKDASGNPLAGKVVRVEGNVADAWQQAGSGTTDATGRYAVKAATACTTVYRAVFDGDADYEQTTSSNAQVTPKASLGKPSAPKTARVSAKITVTCLLRPRHAAGTYPISFQCRHYERGRWVTRLTAKAKAADATSAADASKCGALIRLRLKGSWRIVAVHKADVANASSTSAWRAVSVR